MTTELGALLVLGLWTLALVYLPSTARGRLAGTRWSLGNRDTAPGVPPWIERAERALRNHQENLPLFVITVVVGHLANIHDDVTRGTAVVFVSARVLHAVCYWLGLTPWRSVVFGVALLAQLVFVTRLF
jgi:uncharacterized MAPEG superfamily protein